MHTLYDATLLNVNVEFLCDVDSNEVWDNSVIESRSRMISAHLEKYSIMANMYLYFWAVTFSKGSIITISQVMNGHE